MECAHTKKLLSEYIDGILDRQTWAAVKEHLSGCEDCEKEHVSIKALINELKSMESPEAPKDFLKKVHNRIETRSWFQRIRDLLFLPDRIRIPLNITALAATAVLVFVVFNMVQPRKQVSDLPLKKDIAGIAAEQPLQLTLLMGPARKAKPLPSDDVLFVASGDETKGRDGSAFEFGNGPLGLLNREPDDLTEDIKRFFEENIDSPSDRDKIIANINKIVSLSEGRLLSKEYKEAADYPHYITLEIPVSGYQSFINKIDSTGIGSFQTPIPALPEGSRRQGPGPDPDHTVGIILKKQAQPDYFL